MRQIQDFHVNSCRHDGNDRFESANGAKSANGSSRESNVATAAVSSAASDVGSTTATIENVATGKLYRPEKRIIERGGK